jgi:hypothetical protein
MIRCVLMTVLLVALSTVPSPGQSPPASDAAFLAIVDTYRAGRISDALAELSKWPDARVRGLSRASDRLRDLGESRVKAAVMLHTDVAFALTAALPSLSDRHLERARALVQGLPRTPAVALFKERWQAHAIVAYLWRRDLRLAQLAINRALTDTPRSRDLSLVVGAVIEQRVRAAASDVRGQWTLDPGIRGRMEHDLIAAALAYERALEVDAGFLPARLRLGWVHLINHSRDRAREQLVIVRDQATDADIGYLAHLFLGALEEGEQHPAAALREYEAAHAIAPEAQTGRVSVIRAARAAGQIERARALAAETAERPTMTDDDPWWYFSWGLTSTGSLLWLRQQALAP